MKKHLIIILSIIVSLPSASAITIEYDDNIFNIDATLTSGNILGITIDEEFNAVRIDLDAKEDGQLNIKLPRELIDAKEDGDDADFIIVKGLEIINYQEIAKDEKSRTLLIDIPADTESIEIVGSSVIPEFPVAIIILAICIGILTIKNLNVNNL